MASARISNLLEPSSSAPLNSDTLRCFDTQSVGARILNLLDSAPLERNVLIAYFCMQGGGVAVYGGSNGWQPGSADFSNCDIYQNKAGNVRARISNFWTPLPAPRSLERYVADCILLHAGRWGLHPRWRICGLHRLQHL